MGATLGQKSIVRDGLVLYLDAGNPSSYIGSGTAWKDLSGNGHTGTIDGCTFTTSNHGLLDFDGSNDHVDVASSSDFTFGTGDYTISYWINIDTVTSTETVLDLRDADSSSSTNNGYGDYYQNSSGIKYKTWSNVSNNYYTSTSSFSTGTWYNVTPLRDDGTFKLYINGSLDGSTSNTDDFPSVKCIIGWNVNNQSGKSFDGKMGSIMIYKGKALSATEITQNYNVLKERYI